MNPRHSRVAPRIHRATGALILACVAAIGITWAIAAATSPPSVRTGLEELDGVDPQGNIVASYVNNGPGCENLFSTLAQWPQARPFRGVIGHDMTELDTFAQAAQHWARQYC